MRIIDRDGIERSESWLVANYGKLIIHPANAGPGWRVAELLEIRDAAATPSPFSGAKVLDLREGKALGPDEKEAGAVTATNTLIVKALMADGKPAAGLEIAFYWPDAPEDPAAMPLNGLPSQMRPNRAVHGPTNANGDVGFGMGQGAYYWPQQGQIGPHAAWIHGANSDVILGLGMVAATAHNHIDVVFRYGDTQPAPPPAGDNWAALFSRLDTIAAKLEALRCPYRP